MNRLRNRLILIFLAATLAPLAGTVWITTSLLEHSLDYSSTSELDSMAKSLQRTAVELYQHVRDDLKQQAQSGALKPHKYLPADRAHWPAAVKTFAESEEPEHFVPTGHEGDHLDYLVRHANEVWSYSTALGGMERLTIDREIRVARALVDRASGRDLRRGFKLAYVLAAASIWLMSLALLVYLAHRISQPIHQLTAGLTELAAGDLNARVAARRDDEIGRAIQAFNHMAGKLQESTERLVYLRQLASWKRPAGTWVPRAGRPSARSSCRIRSAASSPA